MSGNRYIKLEKKNLRVIGAAILFIAALFFVLKIMLIIEERNNVIDIDPEINDQNDIDYEAVDQDMVFYDGQWYGLRNDLTTLLLMGIDKDEEYVEQDLEYRNNQQADFLMLLLFDDTAQTVSAIHLNRDTMTEINMIGLNGASTGTRTEQLCLAHTYGAEPKISCENTVQAVSTLLYGARIDHYLSFTMDTVPVVNDYYGGITVHLDEDFTFIDPEMIQGSDYTLFGENALLYIRARMNVGDGSNLSRMKRHREYIYSLLEKVREGENTGKDPMDLFAKLTDSIVSDCTIDQLSDFKKKFDSYALGEISTTEGEAVQGEKHIEYYVDEEALLTMVLETFFEKVNK